MKIQIYKPGFDVSFHRPDNSFTFINPEVKNLVSLLEMGGHEVELLSPSDRRFPRIKNPTHRILVNGRLYEKGDEADERVKREREEVTRIFDGGVPQFRIITDWKIVNKNNLDIPFIDLTQSATEGIDIEYEKMFLFGNSILRNKDKTPGIVYIGNRRGGVRDTQVKEYLITNNITHSLFGNWDLPQSQGKLKYIDTQRVLSKFHYALCLTEDLYKTKAHRTPRVWEAFLSGAIAFVEPNYPRENSVIPAQDFQVAHDAFDLRSKINFLNSNVNRRETLRREQYSKIKPGYLDGSYMLKKLEGALNR